jgi:hypothetical protein
MSMVVKPRERRHPLFVDAPPCAVRLMSVSRFPFGKGGSEGSGQRLQTGADSHDSSSASIMCGTYIYGYEDVMRDGDSVTTVVKNFIILGPWTYYNTTDTCPDLLVRVLYYTRCINLPNVSTISMQKHFLILSPIVACYIKPSE